MPYLNEHSPGYEGLSSSWSHGSWVYNYQCNQCLSPLKLWVRTPFMARCTRYNHYVIKFVSDLRQIGGFLWVLRFPPANKTGRHDITEILLKVALNAININQPWPGYKDSGIAQNYHLPLDKFVTLYFLNIVTYNLIPVKVLEFSTTHSGIHLRHWVSIFTSILQLLPYFNQNNRII